MQLKISCCQGQAKGRENPRPECKMRLGTQSGRLSTADSASPEEKTNGAGGLKSDRER